MSASALLRLRARHASLHRRWCAAWAVVELADLSGDSDASAAARRLFDRLDREHDRYRNMDR